MTKPPGSDDLKGGIKGDAARRGRLAAELRANLKRRKAKGRGGDGEADQRPAAPVSGAGDPDGKT